MASEAFATRKEFFVSPKVTFARGVGTGMHCRMAYGLAIVIWVNECGNYEGKKIWRTEIILEDWTAGECLKMLTTILENGNVRTRGLCPKKEKRTETTLSIKSK